MKFHENLSSGNRALLCGRTEGQIDMAELIAAFRNFADAHKKYTCYQETHLVMVAKLIQMF